MVQLTVIHNTQYIDMYTYNTREEYVLLFLKLYVDIMLWIKASPRLFVRGTRETVFAFCVSGGTVSRANTFTNTKLLYIYNNAFSVWDFAVPPRTNQ